MKDNIKNNLVITHFQNLDLKNWRGVIFSLKKITYGLLMQILKFVIEAYLKSKT